jgi:ribosomal protein S18 acetylase RimI-like enzyme
MILNDSDLTVRPAITSDIVPLTKLIQRKSFVHRHLGWGSPLDWLGFQPYLVLEEKSNILAALACPPDEDGITWLQLFAAAPGFSTFRAWNKLWPQAKRVLKSLKDVRTVNSLAIRPEMDRLLQKAGFLELYQVVVLVWDISRASWPQLKTNASVRLMHQDDLRNVYNVDQRAFNEIWRNSLSQLEAAYREAFSATVIELDGLVLGYQISTVNSKGGHLARLAVNPLYQSRGLGTMLVADLLDRFQDQGIVQVTVNTQSVNIASLDLYRKFGFRLRDDRYPVRQFSFLQKNSRIDQG